MSILQGNSPPMLRVRVNRERCQGHLRCAALAPELFEIGTDGDASEIADGIVPPRFAGRAYLARANCPELAVEIIEAGDRT